MFGLQLKQAAVNLFWACEHIGMGVCCANATVYMCTYTNPLASICESLVHFWGKEHFKVLFLKRILRDAFRFFAEESSQLALVDFPPTTLFSLLSKEGGVTQTPPTMARAEVPELLYSAPLSASVQVKMPPMLRDMHHSAGTYVCCSTCAAIVHSKLNAFNLSAP